MSNFPQDIAAARRILKARGEDPEQYQFTMARNIGDTYFSSCATALYKVTVHKRGGAEQSYELDDDDAGWISQFEKDLTENRFSESVETAGL